MLGDFGIRLFLNCVRIEENEKQGCMYMAIVRCENGHFYDDRKHGECPYCNKVQNTFEDRTMWREMEIQQTETENYKIEKKSV